MKNIIFLLPAFRKPSGGAKVIYRHSNIINNLQNKKTKSFVAHFKKKKTSKFLLSLKKRFIINHNDEFGYHSNDFKIIKNFRPNINWLNETKINYRNDFNFDSKNDIVIFPEIVAHFAKELCIDKGVKYGIYVLGAYHMHQTSNLEQIEEVYNKASFLVDISNDTRNCLKNIFPNLKKKIFRVNLFIDSKKYFSSKNKKNLITCMPRKLNEDFHLLKFFLYKKIPKNWKILQLNDMSNKQIQKKLSISKIFLSFSNFEGLGLPPLEAAFAGNKIIGYTGQAGNEYFKKPIFDKIFKGDILKFAKILEKNIKILENNKWHLNRKVIAQKESLISKYSFNNEIADLCKILNYINKTLI